MQPTYLSMKDWLEGLLLVGIRISGLFLFAPVFSSAAIPATIKAALTIMLTVVLGPLVLSKAGVGISMGLVGILGECMISLLFGFTAGLILELANLTGQLAGMQTSLTLVNLLDPNSRIETTLFAQMFQLLTVTILVAAGLDRLLLASLLRTFEVVPPGALVSRIADVHAFVPTLSGIFLAALQLIAPLLAATILVEVAIGLTAKLSPQLPVIALTIPSKTLVSLLLLGSCLSFWTRFLENRFTQLVGIAQNAVELSFGMKAVP